MSWVLLFNASMEFDPHDREVAANAVREVNRLVEATASIPTWICSKSTRDELAAGRCYAARRIAAVQPSGERTRELLCTQGLTNDADNHRRQTEDRAR
jgi:hypothetical protein